MNPLLDHKTISKAIGIYFKPYLKFHEAMIYCSLSSRQLSERLREYAVMKTATEYYKREDLDRMMAGEQHPDVQRAARIRPAPRLRI